MKKIVNHLKENWIRYGFETLVVVVGVLGAFSLNNWNENRNNSNTEKAYISRLTNEITGDIEYYKKVRDQFIKKENGLKRIILIWQSNDGLVMDSLQYINDFVSAGAGDPWYNEPVTWTQLIQTGELKLITDLRLVDDLFTYYDMVKKTADNFLLHPMNMTNNAREKWPQAFKYENPNNYFVHPFLEVPNSEIYEHIWSDRDEYLGLYSTIAYSSYMQHNFFQGIIVSGENLLEKLKK